ncbi:AMP-binding protein, partial [Mycobacterium intermedium]
EQLRALPPGVTYGVLRYLNEQVDLGGADPVIGFNYLGRVGGDGAASWDGWGLSPEGVSKVAGAAAAIPMPLPHSVELNAATVDSGGGPRLQAGWRYATSVLDEDSVERLSRLWFEALRGICAHVRQGGGGLSPSDIAPARLNQAQIDELQQQYRVADILPLTPLQQGLLFHAATTEGDEELYAVQVSITISGPLDVYRLGASVQEVGTRHPHLLAGFCDRFAEPVQILTVDPVVPWRYVNLVAGDGNADEQIAALCAAERAAVCDLMSGSAFRALLIRTQPNQYRFVLTNHHIVLDGWSLPILLGEVFASYHGQVLAPAVPYRRFISWLSGRDDATARATWGALLAGFDLPTLVGPPDRVGSGRRGVEWSAVSGRTTEALRELARSAQTTLSTVLQAGFAHLLMGLTGQHDVVFGTTISARPTEIAGAESMVGLLINTVPVRATATATTSSADLIGQLHDAYQYTLDHQHLALSEIHRVTGHDQLFDTLFGYENFPVDAAVLNRDDENIWKITEFSAREYNHYPLTVQAFPGTELRLRLEFDTDVFDMVTIHTLVGRFQRVLETMAIDPNRPLSTVDVLDAAEYGRLDVLSNRASLGESSAATASIPALFAAQAARSPDAVALAFGAQSATYRELSEASNRLAHLLIELGAGPGRFVALLLPRSADAVVAILAVLKAGAAYVPIDPGVPDTRVGFVIADAAPVAVITTADLAERLGGHDLPVISVQQAQGYSAAPLPPPDSDDVAYLIYTSGTTGTPKGVAITHRNVTQLMGSLRVGLPQVGVWAQCHSLAFDISVWEIWGALLQGGRLVVVPESATASPEELQSLLIHEKVTVLSQTPSAVSMLNPQALESTALMVAGEACPVGVVDRWAPGRVMIDAYGPTETTMCVAVSTPLVPGMASVPIGVPVPGAALFVLDGWLRPVPVGVVGELYVAGSGVGVG